VEKAVRKGGGAESRRKKWDAGKEKKENEKVRAVYLRRREGEKGAVRSVLGKKEDHDGRR